MPRERGVEGALSWLAARLHWLVAPLSQLAPEAEMQRFPSFKFSRSRKCCVFQVSNSFPYFQISFKIVSKSSCKIAVNGELHFSTRVSKKLGILRDSSFSKNAR